MAIKDTEDEPLATKIIPIGKRVLIRKDENKKSTKGGIVLPDSMEIPTITGRILTVGKGVTEDGDYELQELDKVIFDPREAIPVDFEQDNKLFVVAAEKVIAVISRTSKR